MRELFKGLCDAKPGISMAADLDLSGNAIGSSSISCTIVDVENSIEDDKTPLIKASTSAEAPFSLISLTKVVENPIKRYEQFALRNERFIESLEGTLKSLCYFLPGRFKDAEFVSEIRKRSIV